MLERWYKAVTPLLKHYYGTGGDLNVDEIQDVIPLTENSGVWHPQEGVFNGHFKPTEAEKINRIGQLRHGVVKVIEDENYSPDLSKKYTIADMLTGFGVAEAVKHYYNIYGGSIKGKKAIVIKKISSDIPGKVRVFGDVWTARTEDGQMIEEGQSVEIVKVKGAHLIVKK